MHNLHFLGNLDVLKKLHSFFFDIAKANSPKKKRMAAFPVYLRTERGRPLALVVGQPSREHEDGGFGGRRGDGGTNHTGLWGRESHYWKHGLLEGVCRYRQIHVCRS